MSIPVYHILESNGVTYKKGTVVNRALLKIPLFTAETQSTQRKQSLI